MAGSDVTLVAVHLVGSVADLLHRLDPAISEADHLLAAGRYVRLVGDHHDRAARLVEGVEEIHDFDRSGRIKIAGRLISQNHMRVVNQRPGNRHPLLLATRQLIRPMPKPARKTHQIGQFGC